MTEFSFVGELNPFKYLFFTWMLNFFKLLIFIFSSLSISSLKKRLRQR